MAGWRVIGKGNCGSKTARRMESPGRTKPKGCGKVRYRTKVDALIDAAEIASKGKNGTRVYQCPDCLGWHRTSQQRGARS